MRPTYTRPSAEGPTQEAGAASQPALYAFLTCMRVNINLLVGNKQQQPRRFSSTELRRAKALGPSVLGIFPYSPTENGQTELHNETV